MRFILATGNLCLCDEMKFGRKVYLCRAQQARRFLINMLVTAHLMGMKHSDRSGQMMPESGNLPWVGLPAGQQGNSPGPGGGGRSAWPPPGPSESPPAAASRWLLPPPETPPWLGSAVNKEKKPKTKTLNNVYTSRHIPAEQRRGKKKKV